MSEDWDDYISFEGPPAGLSEGDRLKRNERIGGLFRQLTSEQKKAALEYNGPENHGDPAFLRRRS